MTVLVTTHGIYKIHQFDTEKEFESHVIAQAATIFGDRCVYVDCKRRIGKGAIKMSIPDGYLLDFTIRLAPRLFVVETEIASHDLFQHIGVQLLQFAHSFTGSPREVKQILFEEIFREDKVRSACESHIPEYGLRNLDNMLDYLVHDQFRALVIVDDASDELYKVVNNFRFPIEIIQVTAYQGEKGDFIYRFKPLFEDVTAAVESLGKLEKRLVDPSEFDTIVVPAREEGFKETFLGENRWYEIRINASMIPQIKCIAAYQVAPTSAITHWAQVRNIEPWEMGGKYVVNFLGKAKEIGPIQLVPKSRVKALQNSRYTSFERLQNAKTLDDVF